MAKKKPVIVASGEGMEKTPLTKPFVAVMKHDHSADGTIASRPTYREAVMAVHKFFLSYGFKMKDGKPYDDGNEDGADGGFTCFDDVKLHDGKVAQFTHCGGEGPVAFIRKSV